VKSKFCPCCEIEKPASDFHLRRDHRLASWCKLCNKENSGKYREARKARFAIRKMQIQKEIQMQKDSRAFI